jgi:hypothetical protein
MKGAVRSATWRLVSVLFPCLCLLLLSLATASRAQLNGRVLSDHSDLVRLALGGAFALPQTIRIPPIVTNLSVTGGPDTVLYCRATCFLVSALTTAFALDNVAVRMYTLGNSSGDADRAVIEFEANATHAALPPHPHTLRVSRVKLLFESQLPMQNASLVRFTAAPHLSSIVLDSLSGTFNRLLDGAASLLASLQIRSLAVNCSLDCIQFNSTASSLEIDIFNSSIALTGDAATLLAVTAASGANSDASLTANRSSLSNGVLALTNVDVVRFFNVSLAVAAVDLAGVRALNVTRAVLRPPVARPVDHAFRILLSASSGGTALTLAGIDATGFADRFANVSLLHVAANAIVDRATIADVDIDFFRALLHVEAARVNGGIAIANVRATHTVAALLQPRGSAIDSVTVENVTFSGRLADSVVLVSTAQSIVLRNIAVANAAQTAARALVTLDTVRRSALLASVTARNSTFDALLNVSGAGNGFELTLQSTLLDRAHFSRLVSTTGFTTTIDDLAITDSNCSDRVIAAAGALTAQNVRIARLNARRALVAVPIADCRTLLNWTVVDTQIAEAEPAISLDSTESATYDCALDGVSFTGVRTAHTHLVSAVVLSRAKGRLSLANAAFVDNSGGTALIVKAQLPGDALSVTNLLARNVSSTPLYVDSVGTLTVSGVNVSASRAPNAVFVNAFENATLDDVCVSGTVVRVCRVDNAMIAPIALWNGPVAAVSFAQLLRNNVVACPYAASSGLIVGNVSDLRLASSRFDSNAAANASALVGQDVARGRIETSDFLTNRCSGGRVCSGALTWSARSGGAANLAVATSRFAANVGDSGGAAVLTRCNVTINDTVFWANAASNGVGGALFAARANVTIVRSVFDGDTALGNGAAIGATLSSVLLRDSDVIDSVTTVAAGVPTTGGALAIDQASEIRLQRVSVSGTRINGGTSALANGTDCGALHLGVAPNASVLVDDVCACDAAMGDGSKLNGVTCSNAAMCFWQTTTPLIADVSTACPPAVVGAPCPPDTACPKRVADYVRNVTSSTTRLTTTSTATTAITRATTALGSTTTTVPVAPNSEVSAESNSTVTSSATVLHLSDPPHLTVVVVEVPTWVWVIVGCAALVVVAAIAAVCYVWYKRRQQRRRRALTSQRSLRHLGEEMTSAREESTATEPFETSVAMTTREYGRAGLVPTTQDYIAVGAPGGSVSPSYASVAAAPYDDVSSDLAMSGRSMLNRGGTHRERYDAGYATAQVRRSSDEGGGTVMSSSSRHRRHSGHGHHHSGYASAKVKPPPTEYGSAGGGSVANAGNGYATAHAVQPPPPSEYDQAGLGRDSSRGSRGSRSSRGSRGSLNGSAKAALKKLQASEPQQV